MALPKLVIGTLACEEGLNAADRVIHRLAWELCPRSMLELTQVACMSRNTVIAACRRLAVKDWLTIRREGRSKRPVALIHQRCQDVMAVMLRQQVDIAANVGEFLMKKYLDLRVNDGEYVDNARPGYLVSPLSKHSLEYDRLYLSGAAFEFNGPQHSERTERYPSEYELRQLQARDLIKQSLSRNSSVELITITPEQLRLETLDALIPDSLPKRPLDTDGPYYRTLADLCEQYVINEKRRPNATAR